MGQGTSSLHKHCVKNSKIVTQGGTIGVCLQCMQWDTPPSPLEQLFTYPPGSSHITPLGADHPLWSRHPLEHAPPRSSPPPRADTDTPPGKQTAAYSQRATGIANPTGMHSCFYHLCPNINTSNILLLK